MGVSWGTPGPLPGQPGPTLAMLPVVGQPASMEQVGPVLWKGLHRYALTWDGDELAARRFLDDFARLVPCGSCQEHWRGVIARHPPDLSSPRAFFTWTVVVHNAVRRSQGKTTIDADQALRIWS